MKDLERRIAALEQRAREASPAGHQLDQRAFAEAQRALDDGRDPPPDTLAGQYLLILRRLEDEF